MEGILNRLVSNTEKPYQHIFMELKKNFGKKLVGCVPMHVPEEIISAAGLIPVLIMGSKEPVTLGHKYVPPYFCSPVQELTDLAVKHQLTALEGIIVPNTCHETRGLKDVIQRHSGINWVRGLYLPPTLQSRHIKLYLVECFGELRQSLGELSGQEVSDEALHASISIYNRNRSLMKELYRLRRNHPEVISPKQMAAIVLSGTLMPKDAHNEILETMVSKLEQISFSGKKKNVRLILSGNFCKPIQGELLDLMEETGGMVVDDDLYMGSRYYATLVKEEGDPLEALADAYMYRVPPCPTRYNPDNDWGEYLTDMARTSSAKAVITLVVKFCEPHLYYYRLVQKKLGEAGIAELMIETAAEEAQLPKIKTKLQAFVEMLAVLG